LARKFSDLRPRAAARVLRTQEPIEDVVARLMACPDGHRVLDWMLLEAQAPTPGSVPDERALRQAEGARKFIAKFNAMAEGTYANHRPAGDPDPG